MEGIQLAEETTVMDLGALLDACDDAVVTLVAGDTRLVAHRAVLMDRSPVFGAMFRHNTLESRSGQVTIVDVEGPVLRQLQSYLYSQRAPQLPEMAPQLLVAADKYGVSELKAACELQLSIELSVETAAAAVFLAVRHSCARLRQDAIAYIKTRQVEVMATQGWADAVRMQPEDVDEVRKLLSETRSQSPADTETTARHLPQLRRLFRRLMRPQSLTWESSQMKALEYAMEARAVNLGELLDACDDALVTLVAGDTRLVAHRAVLMDRSPVFNAMFRHDTLESRSGQVTIVDVEGPVLRQLLAFLYTLRAPRLPDTIIELLAAADKYGVLGLKAACELQVAAQLSVETAPAAAVLALRYSCKILRLASITFLMNHINQVMTTCGWTDDMRSQPDDLMEVYRLLVGEIRKLPAEVKSRRLIRAAQQGAVGELEALLAAGADVAAVDGDVWTALHHAASKGQVEAARRLVARGAPVDARDGQQRTPLHEAARLERAAVVRLLLAASADPNARDRNGWTPLHCAALNGQIKAAAALLEAGADRSAKTNWGKTALDYARQGYHQLAALLTRN